MPTGILTIGLGSRDGCCVFIALGVSQCAEIIYSGMAVWVLNTIEGDERLVRPRAGEPNRRQLKLDEVASRFRWLKILRGDKLLHRGGVVVALQGGAGTVDGIHCLSVDRGGVAADEGLVKRSPARFAVAGFDPFEIADLPVAIVSLEPPADRKGFVAVRRGHGIDEGLVAVVALTRTMEYSVQPGSQRLPSESCLWIRPRSTLDDSPMMG